MEWEMVLIHSKNVFTPKENKVDEVLIILKKYLIKKDRKLLRWHIPKTQHTNRKPGKAGKSSEINSIKDYIIKYELYIIKGTSKRMILKIKTWEQSQKQNFNCKALNNTLNSIPSLYKYPYLGKTIWTRRKTGFVLYFCYILLLSNHLMWVLTTCSQTLQ